jgi:hypothetical protein
MLSIILAALPILGKLIPDGKTSDIIAAGTKVAQEVFGTTDEKAIVAKMESDPALAEQFKAKLAAEMEGLRLALASDDSARKQTVMLAEAGSPIAWGAPVMSILVTVGFIGILLIMLLRPIQLDPIQVTVLNVLLGYLGASFAQSTNYWLGSSAGSASKDKVIQNISADNTSSAAKVAAKVVEAAKR